MITTLFVNSQLWAHALLTFQKCMCIYSMYACMYVHMYAQAGGKICHFTFDRDDSEWKIKRGFKVSMETHFRD